VNFTVTARISAQRFSHHYNSMLDALEQGLSLQASGLADVRIVDGNGHARTPAAIYQLLFGAKDTVAPTGGETAVLALAA
jgi:hypothetical protein